MEKKRFCSCRSPLHLAILLVVMVMIIAGCNGSDEISDREVIPLAEEVLPEEGEDSLPEEGATADEPLTTLIPAGLFWYGSPTSDPDAHGDEFVQRQVFLPDFVIYTFEVNNLMYELCVEEGGCTPPHDLDDDLQKYGDPDNYHKPVNGVDWRQADDYCAWAGGRLPTEAEWEKTARGEDALTFPWGEDDPNCDLTNMTGCGDTLDEVGSHPDGQSPWGVYDMAGNAYEWVDDWYNPATYEYSLVSSPAGAPFGTLKVVRGGSFQDGPLTHRAASRYALDPDEYDENLGFRCVLQGETQIAYAPFCAPSYQSFCLPNCQPSDPGQPGGEPDISVVALSCPSGGRSTISLDTGLTNTQGLSVSVNGLPYTHCFEVEEYPGRLYCNGATPPAGYDVQVRVCRDPDEGDNGIPGCEEPYCAEGYELRDGQCLRITTGDNCDEGWLLNPNSLECEPDEQDDCPEGTTFASGQGCTPDNGDECPPDYYNDFYDQTCEPDQNRGGFCLPGYYYNEDINCCSPLKRDNYGCEEDEYYQTGDLAALTDQSELFPAGDGCQPLTWDGCTEGFRFDRQQGCVPVDPDQPPDGEGTRNNCENGYLATGACDPGDNQGNEPCDEGSDYYPDLDRCIQQDGEDDCALGYQTSANNGDACVPSDGPGSPCAPGFTNHPQWDCCVPVPGDPGSSCPEDDQNGDPNMAYFSMNMTGYDFQNGFCYEGDCPPGFSLDEASNTCRPIFENGCPPGTNQRSYDQACEPDTPGECPDGTIPVAANNSCIPDDPNTPDCAEGMTFDWALGYCVNLNTDGCAPGFAAAGQGDSCEPGQPGSNGDEQCWTVVFTVPECTSGEDPGGVCPPGHPFNPQTGECAENPPSGGSGRPNPNKP